jgi:hypothetical protein
MSHLFTRAERAYAEALILHHGGTLPPTPPRPIALPVAPVARAARLLTLGLIAAALSARLLGASDAAAALTLLLLLSSAALLAGGSIPSLARASGLVPLTIRTAGVRAVSLSAVAVGLLSFPPLLPLLGLAFGLRILFRMRRQLMAGVDRSARELELIRLRGGAPPRIYGLIDERHGGDPRRLAAYGEEIARIRTTGR